MNFKTQITNALSLPVQAWTACFCMCAHTSVKETGAFGTLRHFIYAFSRHRLRGCFSNYPPLLWPVATDIRSGVLRGFLRVLKASNVVLSQEGNQSSKASSLEKSGFDTKTLVYCMYCLPCSQGIHVHFLKHMHFLLAQLSGTAKLFLFFTATLKNFQKNIMLLCSHTQNMMNKILKVHIINFIIFIQLRSWENLVLKNFDKTAGSTSVRAPRDNLVFGCKPKLFHSSMQSLVAVFYIYKSGFLVHFHSHTKKKAFLWRLADMPCAHCDFGQQKATFKEDEATLQEKQRREKQFSSQMLQLQGLACRSYPSL